MRWIPSCCRSIFVDVLAKFEGHVSGGEGLDVELFDGDVRRGETLAHRFEERVIALEVADRVLKARREAVGADRLALFVAEVVGVDGDGWRQRELTFDAVEPGRDHA